MRHLIYIIPLILLSCGKGKPQVQAKQLAQQKTIDTADLTMKLSLRRIGTMLNTQELDIAYYRAANLYYQTHKEKYRVQANMLHEQYEKSFALYAAQDDSLNNFLGIVDTVSFLASNGQIPANNLEEDR